MILRNRDANTAWTTASDAALEERRYYCQNCLSGGRGDVAAILTGGGRMAEWAPHSSRYSSYGVPWAMPAGDTDSDGDWDATDEAGITGGYDVRKDAGLDGTVSADDINRPGGYGGSSYIDAVILRERDANTAWASAADGTLEERLYYAQNWRADVVAIVSSAGKLVERVRYSAYGIPTAFPAGDVNCDGDWDASDSTDIGSNYTPGSTYAVLRDADLDGDVDAADVTHANSITGGYQTLGRDVLTSAAVRSRIGYAGYQYDPTFSGLDRHLYHVRHRVYDAEAGRWTRRDPLGYVDGGGLYQYAKSAGHMWVDGFGLQSAPCESKMRQASSIHDDLSALQPARSRCLTDTQAPQCASKCAKSPENTLGETVCWQVIPGAPWSVRYCCICTGHIRIGFPDSDEAGINAITACVTAHEQVHERDCLNQTMFCQSDDCNECDGFLAEYQCLVNILSTCQTQSCRDAVWTRINQVLQSIQFHCAKCPYER